MDYAQYETEIYAKLQPLRDPSSAAFMKNYMKSQLEFLAIKVPVMRGIAFGAATERFSEAERSEFLEKRKAIRTQNRAATKRPGVGKARV